MMIWKDYNTMKDDFNVEWIRIGSTHCWDLPDYKKKAEDLNPISDLNQLKSDLSHLNRFQSKRAMRLHVTIDKTDLEIGVRKKRTPVRDYQLLADHLRVSSSVKSKTHEFILPTGD